MRILHVVRGLANSSGVTHIVGPLAEAQARLGHQVEVFYVEKPGAAPVVPDPSLVMSHGFPMTVPTEHVGWSSGFARAIAGAVKQADAVHVHAIWNFPTLWAMRTAYRAGVPYVVAPQGSLEPWALGRSRLLKRMYAAVAEKRYFDRAASIQALTETEANQCRAFGIRAPIRILPNGVDLDAIDGVEPVDLRAELALPKGAVLLLFVGRMFPKKGLDLLVPAFAAVAAEHPHMHLLVAGHDGGSGYSSTVKEFVSQSGVADRIHLIGELQGSRKFAVLKAADVFVLPSYSEGLPVAVLEAMACAKPVVVTSGCNLPEVDRYDAGRAVGTSVSALAAGLLHISANANERASRGQNARRLVEARFTWSRIAGASLELYAEQPVSDIKRAS